MFLTGLGFNPIDDEDEEDNFYTSGESGSSEEDVEASSEENMRGIKKFELTFEDDDNTGDSNSNLDNGGSDDVLSQEDKMRYFSDRVMSAVVGNKEIKDYALNRLLASVSPRLFRDENYIIFSIIYNYRDRIKKINIDSEFVSLFLDNNKKMLEKARGYIDIHAYGEIDGSPVLGYISGVVKHFNRLAGMDDLSESEFDLNFEKYAVLFKTVEAQKIYANSHMILTDGLKVGGKLLVGFEDSHNYVRRKLSELEGLLDMNKGTGFTSMRDLIMTDVGAAKKPMKVADFDTLDELNKHYGGIYTGNFYQVLAPTKGGKSKFCTRVCHTATVRYGTNVTVWAHEGGNEGWTAQMRAIHFDYTFNEGASPTERKLGVDQDTILHDKFPSQEFKELEMTSKLDLASNIDYGNVDFIDKPFNVETFIDDIDTSVKSNNSKLVIIDYLQLISSENSKMTDRERISRAYTSLLKYCKDNNVAVLTPGQYKQEVISALANRKEGDDAEMRTSGGGSSEVIRTPDVNFAFWGSTADLKNNRMTILSMPCRFYRAFPDIPCYVDLGICKFTSLKG